MNKIHVIILLLFVAFLVPQSALACGSHSEKNHRELSSFDNQKHDCCKKSAKEKSSSKNDDCCNGKRKSNQDNDCGGKCNHSKCGCTLVYPVTSHTFENNFEQQTAVFDLFSYKKAIFKYLSASLSDGFNTIWLIPKIG